MKREDCIQVGYISKAHGIRGDVKAVFDVFDINEYRKTKVFWGGKKKAPLQALTITTFKPQQKQEVILRIAGISDRDAALDLIGTTLFVAETNLPALPAGHFYYFQVVGFQIVDTQLGPLGTIKDFADGAAHDIIMMDYQGKEVLIPITDQIVGKADFEAKTLSTTLPEGLLETYLE